MGTKKRLRRPRWQFRDKWYMRWLKWKEGKRDDR